MIEQAEKDDQMRQMLAVIFQETKGDMNKTVSMWTAGEKMGLDRGQTEMLALDIVGEGLVEIKNLSGGLGLTESGLAQAQASGVGNIGSPPADISSLVEQLTRAMNELGLNPTKRQDLEIDLNVLKAQQKRSHALGPVVKATLSAIEQTLKQSGSDLVKDYLNIVQDLISRG